MAGVANDHFVWRLQGFYSQPRLHIAPPHQVMKTYTVGDTKSAIFVPSSFFLQSASTVDSNKVLGSADATNPRAAQAQDKVKSADGHILRQYSHCFS